MHFEPRVQIKEVIYIFDRPSVFRCKIFPLKAKNLNAFPTLIFTPVLPKNTVLESSKRSFFFLQSSTCPSHSRTKFRLHSLTPKVCLSFQSSYFALITVSETFLFFYFGLFQLYFGYFDVGFMSSMEICDF